MNKIYIDCGFYSGTALRNYVEMGIVDKSWTIYAFEPNPDLGVEQRVRDFFSDLDVNLEEAAVWIKSGTVKFHISGREDAAGIANMTGHSSPKEIKVPSINFSKFVSELPEGYILCNMDIEGSEFSVLNKMLKDNTIDRINYLDIEFHHRLMSDKTDLDSQLLIDQILRRGVGLRLKVPLT